MHVAVHNHRGFGISKNILGVLPRKPKTAVLVEPRIYPYVRIRMNSSVYHTENDQAIARYKSGRKHKVRLYINRNTHSCLCFRHQRGRFSVRTVCCWCIGRIYTAVASSVIVYTKPPTAAHASRAYQVQDISRTPRRQ